jgi:hypothetical protein
VRFRRLAGFAGGLRLSRLQFKHHIDLIVKLNGRLLVGFLAETGAASAAFIMRTIGLG